MTANFLRGSARKEEDKTKTLEIDILQILSGRKKNKKNYIFILLKMFSSCLKMANDDDDCGEKQSSMMLFGSVVGGEESKWEQAPAHVLLLAQLQRACALSPCAP